MKVVDVLATVRDKQGQIVPNLTKDDFVLQEDGRPQTIRYFARETDLPLTLGLLVDTSGSERHLIGQEQTASYRFLVQVLREDRDMAFLIHFDREVELLQDLTSSRKRLETALADLDEPEQQGQWGRRGSPGGPRGGTSLYDAVYLASGELMRKQHGRKALILMSDGEDNASREPLSTAVASAQRADTLVYSILFADERGLNGGFGGYGMGRHRGGPGRLPERRPDGKKVLQRISEDTGGAFFSASKKQTLEDIFNRIQEELRNQYSL
ncbi:MAG: VWA domain-containing protein, partial [Bryobacteraceae bacterium]